MFAEADDSLPQLVSLQTVGEGPQLPLHLLPRVHVGEQLPERQPGGETEVVQTIFRPDTSNPPKGIPIRL